MDEKTERSDWEKMYPMISIFGIGTPSFQIMIIIAISVPLFIMIYQCEKHNLKFRNVIRALLFSTPFVFIAGKLLYIFGAWTVQDAKIGDVLTVFSSGGFVYYGGLIGLIVGIKAFTKMSHQSFRSYMDFVVPYLALGQFFGRTGCFLNGCCYGIRATCILSVHYPMGHPTFGYAVLPVPIFEAIFCLILALFLFHRKQNTKDLQPIFGNYYIYLIAYSVFRFGIEYIRGDLIRGKLWIFTTSQLVSIISIVIIAFLSLLQADNTRKKAQNYMPIIGAIIGAGVGFVASMCMCICVGFQRIFTVNRDAVFSDWSYLITTLIGAAIGALIGYLYEQHISEVQMQEYEDKRKQKQEEEERDRLSLLTETIIKRIVIMTSRSPVYLTQDYFDDTVALFNKECASFKSRIAHMLVTSYDSYVDVIMKRLETIYPLCILDISNYCYISNMLDKDNIRNNAQVKVLLEQVTILRSMPQGNRTLIISDQYGNLNDQGSTMIKEFSSCSEEQFDKMVEYFETDRDIKKALFLEPKGTENYMLFNKYMWFFAFKQPHDEVRFAKALLFCQSLMAVPYNKKDGKPGILPSLDGMLARMKSVLKLGPKNLESMREETDELIKYYIDQKDSMALEFFASGLMWIGAEKNEKELLRLLPSKGIPMSEAMQMRSRVLDTISDGAPQPKNHENYSNNDLSVLRLDTESLSWDINQLNGFFQVLVARRKKLDYELAINEWTPQTPLMLTSENWSEEDAYQKIAEYCKKSFGDSVTCRPISAQLLLQTGDDVLPGLLVMPVADKMPFAYVSLFVSIFQMGLTLDVHIYTLFMPQYANDALAAKAQAVSIKQCANPRATSFVNTARNTALQALQDLINGLVDIQY